MDDGSSIDESSMEDGYKYNKVGFGTLSDWLDEIADDWDTLAILQNYGKYAQNEGGQVVYEDGSTMYPAPINLLNVGYTTEKSEENTFSSNLEKIPELKRYGIRSKKQDTAHISAENSYENESNGMPIIYLGKKDANGNPIIMKDKEGISMGSGRDFPSFPILFHNGSKKEIKWSCAFDSMCLGLMSSLILVKALRPDTSGGKVLNRTRLSITQEKDINKESMIDIMTAFGVDEHSKDVIRSIQQGLWEYCMWASLSENKLGSSYNPIKGLIMYDAYRYALQYVGCRNITNLSVFSKENITPEKLVRRRTIKDSFTRHPTLTPSNVRNTSKEDEKIETKISNGDNYIRSLLNYIKFYHETIRFGFRGTISELSKKVTHSSSGNIEKGDDIDHQGDEYERGSSFDDGRSPESPFRPPRKKRRTFVASRQYPQPGGDSQGTYTVTVKANIAIKTVEKYAVILPFLRYGFYHFYAFNLQMEKWWKNMVKGAVDGKTMGETKYSFVSYRDTDGSPFSLYPRINPRKVTSYNMMFNQVIMPTNSEKSAEVNTRNIVNPYLEDVFYNGPYDLHFSQKYKNNEPSNLLKLVDEEGSIISRDQLRIKETENVGEPQDRVAHDLFGYTKSSKIKRTRANQPRPNFEKKKLFGTTLEYSSITLKGKVASKDVVLEESYKTSLHSTMFYLRDFEPFWLDLRVTNHENIEECREKILSWKKSGSTPDEYIESSLITRENGTNPRHFSGINYNGWIKNDAGWSHSPKGFRVLTAKTLMVFFKFLVLSQVFCLNMSNDADGSVKMFYFGPILARSYSKIDKKQHRYFKDNGESEENGELSVYVPTGVVFQTNKIHFHTECLLPREFGGPKMYPWENADSQNKLKIDYDSKDFDPYFPLSKTHSWVRFDDSKSFNKNWNTIPKEVRLDESVISQYDESKLASRPNQQKEFIPNHPSRPLECNHGSMENMERYYRSGASKESDFLGDNGVNVKDESFYKMAKMGSHWYLVLNAKQNVAITSVYYTKLDMNPKLLMKPPPTRPVGSEKINPVRKEFQRTSENIDTPKADSRTVISIPGGDIPEIAPSARTIPHGNGTVYVSKSNLEGGGRGLFASRNINKNEIVTWYDGKLIDSTEAKKMSEKDNELSSHFRALNREWTIDGKYITKKIQVNYQKWGLGAFINDNADSSKINSVWVSVNSKSKKGLPIEKSYIDSDYATVTDFINIKATKDIKKGDEIYIKYMNRSVYFPGTFDVKAQENDFKAQKNPEINISEENDEKKELEIRVISQLKMKDLFKPDFKNSTGYGLKCGFFAIYNLIKFKEILDKSLVPEKRPNMENLIEILRDRIIESKPNKNTNTIGNIEEFVIWMEKTEDMLCDALDKGSVRNENSRDISYVSRKGTRHPGSIKYDGVTTYEELDYVHVIWIIDNVVKFNARGAEAFFFLFVQDLFSLATKKNIVESEAPPKLILQIENAHKYDINEYSPTSLRLKFTRTDQNSFKPVYSICIIKGHWITNVVLGEYLFTMNSLYDIVDPLVYYERYKKMFLLAWNETTIEDVEKTPPLEYMDPLNDYDESDHLDQLTSQNSEIEAYEDDQYENYSVDTSP